jgi:hypothetical protein
VARATWSGQPDVVTVTVYDALKQVLATGGPSASSSAGQTSNVSVWIPSPQRIAVRFTNTGPVPVTVKVYVGGLNGSP